MSYPVEVAHASNYAFAAAKQHIDRVSDPYLRRQALGVLVDRLINWQNQTEVWKADDLGDLLGFPP